MKQLEGKVAIVTGATRGAGRGIACMLGEAGATVYCTGRSTRGKPSPTNRPETVEETAEMVTARGGVGIWVQVDHTKPRLLPFSWPISCQKSYGSTVSRRLLSPLAAIRADA